MYYESNINNVNIVNCQQCQMSTMSNVNNAKYQQCQISPDLSRFDQINQYLMRSVCRSDNVKMSIQSSKCQSNCQNVNPIVKMAIKFSQCQSNCQNANHIVEMSIELSNVTLSNGMRYQSVC